MNRIVFIIAFLATGLSIAIAQEFNVATYNIRYDAASDTGNLWKDRSPHLAQLIKFHGFDIFGTQEGLKHQLDDLSGMLPGYAYIGAGRDDGKDGGEHSAIFFRSDRFEVVKNGDFWLAENTETPNKGWDAALPRICTWGLFKDKQTGFSFFLFNAHFDHIGVEARKESAKLIVEKAHELGAGIPMVVMGDFNVNQHNESYRVLNEGGEVTDAYELAELRYAPSATFNGFDVKRKGDSRIDHIFVSKPFRVIRYGILTDSYEGKTPSDHFPVMATVRYQ
ncbi:MAG TPA: endonuclease/exonuclease/phosphatase family protein [Parapedobacter sp.]|uniref:endonuclease/exonuclease/phosphatase family protein n=1 Tax=Parapedobacter sp. TaxID=1958893 RepID=UPI002BC955D8|nr:endonuclease/exonuclease/phosphatase family protein [Parapedobacter sp.]HWK56793.1 endonuclease/exonuclease/phosphatase family protein [Parapedobacter sp.]